MGPKTLPHDHGSQKADLRGEKLKKLEGSGGGWKEARDTHVREGTGGKPRPSGGGGFAGPKSVNLGTVRRIKNAALEVQEGVPKRE